MALWGNRPTSSISCTKLKNLNVSRRLAVAFAQSIEARCGVNWERRCSWSSADRCCTNYIGAAPTTSEWSTILLPIDTLRPRQHGRHFPDAIFKCIFLNENVWTLIQISLKFVPKGPIDNIPALVQKMAWRRPGDKPLSEPILIILLTHICVTQPQWVKVWLILEVQW